MVEWVLGFRSFFLWDPTLLRARVCSSMATLLCLLISLSFGLLLKSNRLYEWTMSGNGNKRNNANEVNIVSHFNPIASFALPFDLFTFGISTERQIPFDAKSNFNFD